MEENNEIQAEVLQQISREILHIPVVYLDITKSIKTGVLLALLMQIFAEEDKFSRTNEELQQKIRISRHCIIEGKKEITKLGFIKITKEGLPPKTYYEIDWDEYEKVIYELTR